MAMNDPLASAFSTIINAERKGKQECVIRISSRLIRKALELLQQEHYIGSSEEFQDNRGKLLKVNLLGQLNKCGVIKPRY